MERIYWDDLNDRQMEVAAEIENNWAIWRNVEWLQNCIQKKIDRAARKGGTFVPEFAHLRDCSTMKAIERAGRKAANVRLSHDEMKEVRAYIAGMALEDFAVTA